jgi:hypothetical protein
MTSNRAFFRLLGGVKLLMLHAGVLFGAKIITIGASAPVHARHSLSFSCGQSLPRGNIEVIDDRGCLFNKRTIMTGHEHWPRPICYLLDQKAYGFVIKMIGGFIQDQSYWSDHNDACQFEPHCLARGE